MSVSSEYTQDIPYL